MLETIIEELKEHLVGVLVSHLFQQDIYFLANILPNNVIDLQELVYAFLEALPDTLMFPHQLGTPKMVEISLNKNTLLLLYPVLAGRNAIFLLVTNDAPVNRILNFLEKNKRIVESELEGLLHERKENFNS